MLGRRVEDPREALVELVAHLHRAGVAVFCCCSWGYRDSPLTAATTALWTLAYRLAPRQVGGCRPQRLAPYLAARGWVVERSTRTRPVGFPWMMSEVICARPPPPEFEP